jgi:hypothetical protein
LSKLSVSELASEFAVSAEDVVSVLRQMDIPIRSHMSMLTDDQVARIRARWEREKRARAEKQAAPAPSARRRRTAAPEPAPVPEPVSTDPVRRRRKAADVQAAAEEHAAAEAAAAQAAAEQAERTRRCRRACPEAAARCFAPRKLPLRQAAAAAIAAERGTTWNPSLSARSPTAHDPLRLRTRIPERSNARRVPSHRVLRVRVQWRSGFPPRPIASAPRRWS